FASNTSEMKKMATRDFEDLLQCAIPAFEGLLEGEHNARFMRLLYRAAEWHALAKLRMHTDPTLDRLDKVTAEFGRLMREFRDFTCTKFDTVELPHEAQACARCQVESAGLSTDATQNATRVAQRKTKGLNLQTYKFHAMGDYVPTIKLFGTSDSYSTQPVCSPLLGCFFS
ncbi:hypothetical protein BT96DRAFT_840707, partial [Gymnopus androsaceus JB14]